jgi:hypothetical protein
MMLEVRKPTSISKSILAGCRVDHVRQMPVKDFLKSVVSTLVSSEERNIKRILLQFSYLTALHITVYFLIKSQKLI